MLFIVLLFLCVTLVVLMLKNTNSDYWKKRNIKQVNGLLPAFVFGKRALAELYKELYDNHPNESNVGFFIGQKPALLLKDIENIQAVLQSDFQSFYQRGIPINPDDILADNVLFIEDYARWKILRQKLTPVFTSSKLKNMFNIMDRCAQDFVKRITENPNVVNIPFDALYTYTTASIAASVFGIDAQIENTMDSPFLDMAKAAVQPSFKRSISFAIGNLSTRLVRFLNLKAFGDYEQFFINVVKNVIDNRRNEKVKRHDFIDICLELQDQGIMRDDSIGYELEPTVEVLAAQAFFFFVAGSDTSAGTMHFALMELSNNPDILRKVHHEIDSVFENCNEKLTYDELDKFKYLEMVINESMRKYPSVGLMQRKCTKSTTLPVGQIKIEKDCLVVVPVYAIHRDEKYYPYPEVFDPERFSPENITKIPKFAFIPFGEGNRICLGMRFARMQVKAGLARLLRCYTLRPQSVNPKTFEPSVFALRAPHIQYEFIRRN